MRRNIKVKTDYKHSTNKSTFDVMNVASKWKLPLALSGLAFVMLWKLVNWLSLLNTEQPDQEWVNPHQVILDIALPKNEEQTSLLQQATLNEVAQILSIGKNLLSRPVIILALTFNWLALNQRHCKKCSCSKKRITLKEFTLDKN